MATCLALAMPARAQEAQADQTAELAQELANPLAALISVPLQYNRDDNYGTDDEGSASRLNVQPVIPFSVSDGWNVITRTIVPLIDQQDVPVRGVSDSGLGDITASQFFSPKAPSAGGWIWGVGPVELLPTATEDTLGGEKWGLGPTGVALKQSGPWTIGALANHIWSVGGDDDRADVNATFLQPFVSYLTRTRTTLAVSSESTYDWKNDAWSVPLIVMAQQMLKVGPQIMQVGVGAKYWVESPDSGPEGWALRAQVTLLYPN